MMKYVSFLFPPLFAVAVAIGCNTATLSQPAVIDACPACPVRAPLATCDAGAATPGACRGGVTLQLDDPDSPDASNTVAPGYYPLGCGLQFYIAAEGTSDCILAPVCLCTTPDAGTSEDGGTVIDAGVQPGFWQCFASQ